MIKPQRASPLVALLAPLVAEWSTRNRMAVPTRLKHPANVPPPVWLADTSHRFRFGFKGAGAPEWCDTQGLPLPPGANRFASLEGGGLIGRLAFTEFYVEHDSEEVVVALVRALGRGCQKGGGGVYPVARRDAGIVLGGPLGRDLLLQTCNVNFAALDLGPNPLIMTTIVGVAVTVFPQVEAGEVRYRMACDPTFAPYLWATLLGIARESGGGVLLL